MKVAQNIHHFDTGPFNWYLIEESQRLTLVDAGFPGHYHTFLKGIQSLGYAIKDIEAIILTHAHADHIGFAERVRKESRAPVYSSTAKMPKWLANLCNYPGGDCSLMPGDLIPLPCWE